ncbi:MAG TPA: hypothetical protein VL943_13115 [Niabella sp.]|nr:hypothetical protein [Niabella sp.]
MQKAILYIRKHKQLLLVGLLVFALAPCTVKETWFSLAGFDYVQPLNRSQTTTSGQQCQYRQGSEQKVHVHQNKPAIRQYPSGYLASKNYPAIAAAGCTCEPLILLRANSPPIYILYKRLKLDLV